MSRDATTDTATRNPPCGEILKGFSLPRHSSLNHQHKRSLRSHGTPKSPLNILELNLDTGLRNHHHSWHCRQTPLSTPSAVAMFTSGSLQIQDVITPQPKAGPLAAVTKHTELTAVPVRRTLVDLDTDMNRTFLSIGECRPECRKVQCRQYLNK